MYLNKVNEYNTQPVPNSSVEYFWQDERELVLCWLGSSGNKVSVFTVKTPAAGAKGGVKLVSEGQHVLSGRIVLVDDLKHVIHGGDTKVLACLCGIERRNVFVYIDGKLWCTVKGELERVGCIFVIYFYAPYASARKSACPPGNHRRHQSYSDSLALAATDNITQHHYLVCVVYTIIGSYLNCKC